MFLHAPDRELLELGVRVVAAGGRVSPLVLNVNLSALQLHRRDLLATIERTLRETGLEPRFDELELGFGAMSNGNGVSEYVVPKPICGSGGGG